ncbi:peroxidase 5-like [Asparagus officinalis]|uniref:peroxidase 5-like n=1 Tax=Asparagus officinalis TaxID=4686 RepID=UPI00098E728C|nr:peroxidase 5-like [Asparagus officinalis]
MRDLNGPSPFSFFSFVVLLSSLFFFLALGDGEDGSEKGLKVGFYNHSCPQAERIVLRAVVRNSLINTEVPAGIIRLLFHDCWIRGCDASLLLERTPESQEGQTEKASPANGKTLRGVEVIHEAKAALEAECPNTVSCADILSFAARDAVTIAGDPTLDVMYAEVLKARCPQTESLLTLITKGLDLDSAMKVPFDVGTSQKLDASYYRHLMKGRGLLTSDQTLTNDERTSRIVKELSEKPGLWEDLFTKAMAKLSAVGVLVGDQGEIRRDCRFVNEDQGESGQTESVQTQSGQMESGQTHSDQEESGQRESEFAVSGFLGFNE